MHKVRPIIMTAPRAGLMAAALVAILVLRSAKASGASCSYFATPPPTPAKGAVLWWKSDNPYAPNTLVLSVGDHFTDVDNCYEPIQSPWVISVAPGGALVFYGLDAYTGKNDALISVWGALNVPEPGSGPLETNPLSPFIGGVEHDWSFTTSVALMDPAAVLSNYGSCTQCDLSNRKVVLPGCYPQGGFVVGFGGQPLGSVPQITGAKLQGATVTGDSCNADFSGSDISGAHFTGVFGATFGHVTTNGTTFAGAHLQGAAFDTLEFQTPPSFAGATLGGPAGCTTSIANTNLLEVSFAGTAWASGWSGTARASGSSGCTNALFPGSQVPLRAVQQLLVTDKAAAINWTGAQVVASAADRNALAGADLSGVNLVGVTFLGESLDLTGTRFDGATLTQINLTGARLAGASFANVSAAAASFSNADLSGDATHSGASFAGSQTNLQGANFVTANVSGASFVGADLTGAVFTGVRGVNTDFTGADLTQTLLSKSSLQHANLSTAKLYGASLTDANLESANLQSADLTNNPPNIQQAADLSGAFLRNANLSFAQLSGANFTNASFYGFTGAYGPGGGSCAVQNGETNGCATAHGAVMNNTVFSGAYLFGVDFTNTQATGANFGNAVLVGANFDSATLASDPAAASTTSFESAFLQGANLAGAKTLDHVSLASAFVDFNPKGNTVDIQLPGTHTQFPGYWGTSGNDVCAEPGYSSPTTVPTTNSTITCPDGNKYPDGCGAADPQGTNPHWNSGTNISSANTPASYQQNATYTPASTNPICTDDPIWDVGNNYRPARKHQ